MKLKLRFFRAVELFATGYFRVLSAQYTGKHPDIAKKLLEFADNEYDHSRMFGKCYLDMFGKSPGREATWIGLGKFQAFINRLLPLRLKIKIVCSLEDLAIRSILKEIESGESNKFIDVLKKILPDERKHAALYRMLYG
jgi:rubrerythrin